MSVIIQHPCLVLAPFSDYQHNTKSDDLLSRCNIDQSG